MKLDLSSIINDLITGKAKILDEHFTFEAGAGAAIGPENFFVCPPRTLRIILRASISVVKATATVLVISTCNFQGTTEGYLFNRTTAATSDLLAIPTDDGSDKDEAEMAANTLMLMKHDDYLNIYHALTAGETIVDHIYIRFIEYTGVDVL